MSKTWKITAVRKPKTYKFTTLQKRNIALRTVGDQNVGGNLLGQHMVHSNKKTQYNRADFKRADKWS